MAAGWPVKTTYLDGDVYSAADVNDANGTLNYINPTSATDLQVLTRDNASAGKVKWANSPANIATTTGDILYASSANTLARLGIGSTNQVLAVSGGLPSWQSVSGGYTLISTANVAGTQTTTFSSINQGYRNLVLYFSNLGTGTVGDQILIRVNSISALNCYQYSYFASTGTAITNATNTSIYLNTLSNAAAKINGQATIFDYANTTVNIKQVTLTSGSWNPNTAFTNAFTMTSNILGTTASTYDGVGAITSVTVLANGASNFTTGSTISLYGVK